MEIPQPQPELATQAAQEESVRRLSLGALRRFASRRHEVTEPVAGAVDQQWDCAAGFEDVNEVVTATPDTRGALLVDVEDDIGGLSDYDASGIALHSMVRLGEKTYSLWRSKDQTGKLAVTDETYDPAKQKDTLTWYDLATKQDIPLASSRNKKHPTPGGLLQLNRDEIGVRVEPGAPNAQILKRKGVEFFQAQQAADAQRVRDAEEAERYREWLAQAPQREAEAAAQAELNRLERERLYEARLQTIFGSVFVPEDENAEQDRIKIDIEDFFKAPVPKTDPDQFKWKGPDMRGRTTVTPESENEASLLISSLAHGRSKFAEVLRNFGGDTMGSRELSAKLRLDSDFRLAVGKYILGYIDRHPGSLKVSGRNGFKNPDRAVYFRNMTSQEYVALLITAKMDGTFITKDESSDPILQNKDGFGYEQGQHRASAESILRYIGFED